jgi:hypothetical protein
MHVDRSRFLLLTASLAAAACNQPGATIATPETGGVDPAKSSDAATTTGNQSVWLEIEPGTEDKPQALGTADCDNDLGRVTACNLSAPGSHCESFDSSVRLCRSFTDVLRPRAAEAATNCMMAASGSWEICDWSFGINCITSGLQAACVEPSSRPECDSISAHCGGSLDVFTCQQALSAVRVQHMQSLVSCVREFCEVPYCVMDLGMW